MSTTLPGPQRPVRRTRRKDVGAYEAFDDILPGDVIRWNGRLRKVRGVTWYEDDRVYSVDFAILRPSWTNRPCTSYTRTEIRNAFGGVVARGTSLCTTDAECRVQREIEEPSRWGALQITARESVGLVY